MQAVKSIAKPTFKRKLKKRVKLFNSEKAKIIKRIVREYGIMINEFTMEHKPVPKQRSFYPKAPLPTPRRRSKVKIEKCSSGFIPEDDISQISVKEKVRLYTKFVEEMEKNDFKISSMLRSNKLTVKVNSGKVKEGKQSTVKDLRNELEFKSVFPHISTATKAKIRRMGSMKGDFAVYRNSPNTEQDEEKLPRKQPRKPDHIFCCWTSGRDEMDKDINKSRNQSNIDEKKKDSTTDELLLEDITLKMSEADQVVEPPKPMPRKRKAMSLNASSGGKDCEVFESFCCKKIPKCADWKDHKAPSTEVETKLEHQIDEQVDIQTHPDELVRVEPNQTHLISQLHKNKAAYSLTFNDLETFLSTQRSSDLFSDELQNSGVYCTTALKFAVDESLTDEGFKTDTNSTDSAFEKGVSAKIASSIDQTSVSNPMQRYSGHQPDSIASQPYDKQTEIHFSPGYDHLLQRSFNSPFTELEKPTSISPRTQEFVKESRNTTIFHRLAKKLFKSSKANTKSNSVSPIEKTKTQEKAKKNSSLSSNINSANGSTVGYTTPVEAQEQESFLRKTATKRKSCLTLKPIKRRCLSVHKLEYPCGSLPIRLTGEEQTIGSDGYLYSLNTENFKSQFWINCGDFHVSFDINYVSVERLRSLYDIFSSRISDINDINFGIDDNKFFHQEPMEMSAASINYSKKYSHYWVSTGECTIPFKGKILSRHKIQRLLRVIKETTEETGILSFGVDDFEFSAIREFIYEEPKFSVVNEIDQTNKRSLNFDDAENTPLAQEFSFDRSCPAMVDIDSICDEYEYESLDQRFDSTNRTCQQNISKQTEKNDIPDIIQTVSNVEQRLTALQHQLSNYGKSFLTAKASLDFYKRIPEYVEKLNQIVSDITDIHFTTGFKRCSIEELNSYMYFLTRYSEICLSNCNKHIDLVLKGLGGCKETSV